MAYRRFVSYIYEYSGGKKGENRGFVRVEVKNGICQMGFGLEIGDLPEKCRIRVLGIVRENRRLLVIPLGELAAGSGGIRGQVRFPEQQAGNSPYHMEQMGGLLLVSEGGRQFATQWDDEPLRLEWLEEWKAKQERDPKEDRVENHMEHHMENREEKKEPAKQLREIPEGRQPESVREPAEQQAKQKNQSKAGRAGDSDMKGEPESAPDRRADRPNPASERQGNRQESAPGSREECRGSVPEHREERRKSAPGCRADRPDSALERQGNRQESASGNRGAYPGYGADSRDGYSRFGAENRTECPEKGNGAGCPQRMASGGRNRTGAPNGNQPARPGMGSSPGRMKGKQETPESAGQEMQRHDAEKTEAGADRTSGAFGWEQIRNLCTHCQPFHDDLLTECVKVTRQDLWQLRRNGWQIDSSQFQNYGLDRYGHLLLCRDAANPEAFYLGVPGVFSTNEQFMAGLFGFYHFRPAKPPAEGPARPKFGYWCRRILPGFPGKEK